MPILSVKSNGEWHSIPAIKGDPGDPAADESITDDMLVTDGIKTEIEWLWGNQLTDSREGELLHAEDAYTAPAVDISVDGKSTQLTTTGKNLFDKSAVTSSRYINSSGGLSPWNMASASDYTPVEPNTIYTLSFASMCGNQGLAFYTDANVESFISYTSVSSTTLLTFTTPENAAYLRFSCYITVLDSAQLEAGSSATAYESYTGGKPSPRPDYPQEIVSVDEPIAHITNKNMLDLPSSLVMLSYGGTWRVPTAGGESNVVTITDDSVTIDPHNSNYGLYISIGRFPAGTYTLSVTKLPAGAVTVYSHTTKPEYGTRDPSKITALVSGLSGQTSGSLTFTLDESQWLLIGVYVSSTSPIGVSNIQLELGSTATTYEPYLGNTASLLPDGYSLRSLPDGTKDELHLSYLRPSKREGWAWYSRELVKRVGKFIATSPNGWIKSNFASNGYYKSVGQITDGLGKPNAKNSIMSPWFKAPDSLSEYFQTVNSCWVDSAVNFNIDPDVFSGTALEFGAWVAEHNIEYYMPLATPTTETLDPIELPIMPSRTVNVWSDPATNLKMTYIQDSNLIIENLEATIADIATS